MDLVGHDSTNPPPRAVDARRNVDLHHPHTGITQDRQLPKTAERKLVSQKDHTSVRAMTKPALTRQPAGLPVYKPPRRGVPAGRVAGGTRGAGNALPLLSALAPDHAGFSVHAQPTLYWYLSEAVSYPIEFTLIDDQAIEPLLEKRLPPHQHPGVKQIPLAAYRVSLRPGVPYQWYVTLVVDPEQRSKDIVVGGTIERMASPDALRSQLTQVGPAQAPFVYAEAGLWYDAVMVVSQMIDGAPQDRGLRRQRAALLEQVGLENIAKHDLQRRTVK